MGGFLLGFHQYGLEEMENVAHSVLEVILIARFYSLDSIPKRVSEESQKMF